MYLHNSVTWLSDDTCSSSLFPTTRRRVGGESMFHESTPPSYHHYHTIARFERFEWSLYWSSSCIKPTSIHLLINAAAEALKHLVNFTTEVSAGDELGLRNQR